MTRSYGQDCALADALDLVGERWTLLIVRELMLGPRRYSELLDNLPGIGTNLLATRLRTLSGANLVEKSGQSYRLSEHGRALEPVVDALVRFGLTLDTPTGEKRVSRPQWDAVAIRALHDPGLDDGLKGRFVLELDGDPFCIEKLGPELTVQPGDCTAAESRVTLSRALARRLARGEASVQQAVDAGEIGIRGEHDSGRRLLASLRLSATD